mgnify:CR=1 FL=1
MKKITLRETDTYFDYTIRGGQMSKTTMIQTGYMIPRGLYAQMQEIVAEIKKIDPRFSQGEFIRQAISRMIAEERK